nr:MAG TPA: hypothetical protein [Caudoviricetes sp.]
MTTYNCQSYTKIPLQDFHLIRGISSILKTEEYKVF